MDIIKINNLFIYYNNEATKDRKTLGWIFVGSDYLIYYGRGVKK